MFFIENKKKQYRNILAFFESPTFIKQTPFLRYKILLNQHNELINRYVNPL